MSSVDDKSEPLVLPRRTESSVDCPLPASTQTQNLCIYAANWALLYFASPVTYVGLVQATLVNKLGFTDTEANLPASVYLWASPFSVLVVCGFSHVRMLKPLLISSFVAAAILGLMVMAALFSPSPTFVLASLIGYAMVWGVGNGVMASCQWEMVGRGVTASRRGQALGLAFGAGPVLAVFSSLASQSILGGDAAVISLPFVPALAYPWNFAILYGASVPILLLAALQSSFFVVPQTTAAEPVEPFFVRVFGGFGEFFRTRLILIAAIAYILVYSGHEILQNLSLYAKEALSEEPSKYAGFQLTLRFGFKIFAGFALGWLLMATNPKALLLVTASLTLMAVLWALAVPGFWYLVAFGILGAGELFGVYYPNYILGCSPPAKMRRNMAFASLVTMPVGFAPVMYGAISDAFENKLHGFQMSFMAAIAILILTMLLVATMLPRQPQPQGNSR